MRSSHRGVVVGSVVALLFGAVVLAGVTTPPAGPISSTMKDLNEVEPRVAINATNTPGDVTNSFVISQPGSYYLSSNILGEAGKNGIIINSMDVTLDLNGFTLKGVAGSLSGIYQPTFYVNVIIHNGIVTAWDKHGIDTRIDYGRIEKIIATNNGGWGITNATAGTFSSRIIDCQAGLNGRIIANTGGIRGGSFSVIRDCAVTKNIGAGIQVQSRSSVFQNVCENSFTNGAVGSIGRGIYVLGSENLIDRNSIVGCPTGIVMAGSGNIMIRNTVLKISITAVGYTWAAGNDVGPAGNTASISTSPFANLEF
jgi:hypothetical protein